MIDVVAGMATDDWCGHEIYNVCVGALDDGGLVIHDTISPLAGVCFQVGRDDEGGRCLSLTGSIK